MKVGYIELKGSSLKEFEMCYRFQAFLFALVSTNLLLQYVWKKFHSSVFPGVLLFKS